MPAVEWIYQNPSRVTSLSLSRETGELFVTDEKQGLSRINSKGELSQLVQLPGTARQVVISENGQWGTALTGPSTFFRFNRSLACEWELILDAPCLTMAMPPYGFQLAIANAEGQTILFNERKRRTATFESERPLASLAFCNQSPFLTGAAEHGLVVSFDIKGKEIWKERSWSNVGDLCMTGDGSLTYLASAAHGVQALDSNGQTIGSYLTEGTTSRVACSDEPAMLITSTVERHLFVNDNNGDAIWSTEIPEDVVDLCCDASGKSVTVALTNGEIYRLNWGGL